MRGQIDQAGRMRCDPRPQVDVAEGVGAARTHAAFVVVRQELGFVRGHVDADRAIAFASFAGQAEIERLFDFFAAPAVADDSISSTLALGHLPEQVGAAARGVFFVVRGAVAGAHQAAFFAAALAHAHAAQSGLGQAAVVGGELEIGFRFPGGVVSAEAKILVEFVRLDQLAGIHLPFGIPCRLEFAEGLNQFRAEHFWKQFAAGLAVAVFAGNGAAIADHEVGSGFHKLAELGDTVFRLQVEIDAVVNAAMAEVAVERALVAEVREHFAEIAEIAAEFFRGDGGIFKAFPVERFAGHMRGDAEAGFANFPHALGLLMVSAEPHVGRVRAAAERLHQAAGLGFGFPRGFCAELDHQPSAAFGQERESFGVDAFLSRVADQQFVEALEADGLVRHDLGHVVGALINVRIGDDQQHAFRRTLDQTAGGFENGDASAFGADERASDVEAILGQKLVQVVAGDAAGNVGEALADLIAVGGGNRF